MHLAVQALQVPVLSRLRGSRAFQLHMNDWPMRFKDHEGWTKKFLRKQVKIRNEQVLD